MFVGECWRSTNVWIHKNISELKNVLLKIWDELPQYAEKESIASFRKRLRACINTGGGHFEHSL